LARISASNSSKYKTLVGRKDVGRQKCAVNPFGRDVLNGYILIPKDFKKYILRDTKKYYHFLNWKQGISLKWPSLVIKVNPCCNSMAAIPAFGASNSSNYKTVVGSRMSGGQSALAILVPGKYHNWCAFINFQFPKLYFKGDAPWSNYLFVYLLQSGGSYGA